MKKKTKFAVIFALIAALILSNTVSAFAASKTKKMTVYNEVIKSDKYVYCAAGNGIYKIDLETGSNQKLVKNDAYPFVGIGGMKLYKGYLYYLTGGSGIASPSLYRIKTNGKGNKKLDSADMYVIKKKKVYYTKRVGDSYNKSVKRQMNLNGSKKKKSSYRVKSTFKDSNATGYYIKQVESGSGVYSDYLVTPDKQILISTYQDAM
jgi:predicted methyltransferase